MRESIRVTDIAFTPATTTCRDTGVLGWISCTLNDAVRLDGLTLRRSSDGVVYVAYPARLDHRGYRWPYVRPIVESARVEIERQILDAIERGGREAS